MAEYITLTCPSCGSKLKITENIDRFACSHCGNEHIINRGDGIVSISPIVEGLEKVQRGTDKTASELAIKRIKSEIAELEQSLVKSEERRGEDFGCIFFIALVIFLILLFFTITGDISPIILSGIIILIIGVCIYYFQRDSSSIEKESSEIMQLINKKHKELRKHLDEVSN